MNELEKKAIEGLKTLKEYMGDNFTFSMQGIRNLREHLKIVLNLIDKQQKEIDKLQLKNEGLLRKLKNRVKENKKLIKYSNYKKEFSTLNKQIDKQNKVIDEMANDIRLWRLDNAITDNVESIEDIKQYFIRKVE